METNKWSEKEAKRAENTWGDQRRQYSLDMFDFIIKDGKSWLDLGCGFGRFLTYLEEEVPEPDYIGYDSSPDMLKRLHKNHPDYEHRTFVKDITAPIRNEQQCVLCSAVFVHLPLRDQEKIMSNVSQIQPYKFAFDINWDASVEYVERFIKLTEHKFRMTWQHPSTLGNFLIRMFSNYDIKSEIYTLPQKDRSKVVYMLTKRGVILGG